jgi:hypothetical protein
MYDNQNEEICSLLNIAKRYSLNINKKSSELYMHSQIIPTILQLDEIFSLEGNVYTFFSKFVNHNNVSCGYFSRILLYKSRIYLHNYVFI